MGAQICTRGIFEAPVKLLNCATRTGTISPGLKIAGKGLANIGKKAGTWTVTLYRC